MSVDHTSLLASSLAAHAAIRRNHIPAVIIQSLMHERAIARDLAASEVLADLQGVPLVAEVAG